MPEILRVSNLTKRFSRITANKDVNLSVNAGEVRALLGENGAGKSTLMNCLYGNYAMDEGELFIGEKKVSIKSCQDAIKHGIGMINQHFMLVQRLTVLENVILGLKENRGKLRLNTAGAARKIREISNRYKFNIDPYAIVEDLPLGMQQRIEIIKILFRDSNIMIFDEPTAVLTPNEIEDFFSIIRQFKNEDRTVLFITHKLNEVMAICDSVTVLRDGCVVADTVIDKQTSEKDLARMMVGREIDLTTAPPAESTGDTILEVKDLYCLDQDKTETVSGLSLSVCAGEILGIAGVDGNGQMELGKAITGMYPVESGQIYISGTETTSLGPKQLHDCGVSYIPADRHKTGLILDFSFSENLICKEISRKPFSRLGIQKKNNIKEYADRMIESYNIRGTSSETRAKQLSGGNQQKIILARELSKKPKLIVAIQPTRGLDISAVDFVRKELIRMRNEGAAVLLISTELEEILALSDRIEIIYEGKFTGSVEKENIDIAQIGLQMAGKVKENSKQEVFS